MNIKNFNRVNEIISEGQRLEKEIEELHNTAKGVITKDYTLNVDLTYSIKGEVEPQMNDAESYLTFSFFSQSMHPSQKKKPIKHEIENVFNDVESLELINYLVNKKQERLIQLKNELKEINKNFEILEN